jgi:hypothetical protein
LNSRIHLPPDMKTKFQISFNFFVPLFRKLIILVWPGRNQCCAAADSKNGSNAAYLLYPMILPWTWMNNRANGGECWFAAFNSNSTRVLYTPTTLNTTPAHWKDKGEDHWGISRMSSEIFAAQSAQPYCLITLQN